jgi:hypothetical protein
MVLKRVAGPRAPLCCVVMVLLGHAVPALGHNWTIYHGQGVDTDLLEFPAKLLHGELPREDSHFDGVGLYIATPTPQLIERGGARLGLENLTTGVELIAVKHRGLQHNYETDVAYLLGLPPVSLGALRIKFSAGMGLSYAFGRPSYEDGPEDDPDRRYRFQSYNAYEFAWSLADYPDVAFVTRVHHRSGIYGLIAPRHVGSNFFTLGLRVQF